MSCQLAACVLTGKCIQVVFRLTDVGDGKLLYAQYAFPGFGVFTYSGFKVASNNEIVVIFAGTFY